MDPVSCTPTACNVCLILCVVGVSPVDVVCRESNPIKRNLANRRIVIWMPTTRPPPSSRSIRRSVSTVLTTFRANSV